MTRFNGAASETSSNKKLDPMPALFTRWSTSTNKHHRASCNDLLICTQIFSKPNKRCKAQNASKTTLTMAVVADRVFDDSPAILFLAHVRHYGSHVHGTSLDGAIRNHTQPPFSARNQDQDCPFLCILVGCLLHITYARCTSTWITMTSTSIKLWSHWCMIHNTIHSKHIIFLPYFVW